MCGEQGQGCVGPGDAGFEALSAGGPASAAAGGGMTLLAVLLCTLVRGAKLQEAKARACRTCSGALPLDAAWHGVGGTSRSKDALTGYCEESMEDIRTPLPWREGLCMGQTVQCPAKAAARSPDEPLEALRAARADASGGAAQPRGGDVRRRHPPAACGPLPAGERSELESNRFSHQRLLMLSQCKAYFPFKTVRARSLWLWEPSR